MSLLINSVGDNPFRPGINADVYIPDQLIAGDAKIVSDDGAVVTGGVLLPRGTVMGQIVDGAATTASGVQATGTITFTGQPLAADTITLNGTVVTFVAATAAPTGNQVRLGSTSEQTVENLLIFLRASTDTQLVKFSYSAVDLVVTLTAVTGGTGGNSLTLAESATNVAVSGATLAGGVSNTGNGTISAVTLGAGAQLGNYALVCTQATTGTPAATSQPEGGNVGTGVMGTVTPSAGSQLGQYQVILTATGATAAFKVVAPDGTIAGTGNVATAYGTGGLAFTLANGGTMTAGDVWNIFVTDNGVAKFSVTSPAGGVRPVATVGTAYSDQIGFTLTNGATKFVVGDSFRVTIGTGSLKWKQSVKTATDGSQIPRGVLGDETDAVDGDVNAAVYVGGEFNWLRMWYDPSWDYAALKAAFAGTPIFIKTAVSADNPT